VLQYTSLDNVDWNVMVPATVQRTLTGNVMVTFHECVEEPQDEEGEAHTFREYMKKLPEHERRLLWHIEFAPGGESILKSCLQCNMILKLGTDGSFHQEKETASFGWVLLGNQTLLVQGSGPVDGVPSMMSSTRAELFGIASPNEFLHHFMKYHQIESTSKCLKCVDNKAAIS
jgi:hypothetical protein